MQNDAKTRILYVHHRSELGGAPTSLSQLISNLDRDRYEPEVYCPRGEAAQLFRRAGAIVHTGPVAGFTHIWASVYRGRRWLLFVRELGRLPAHVICLRRVIARGHYDLVHLNDSPLIAAAWLARRADIPVVWHLRSAPPKGGQDRRSRFVRRLMLRLGDAAIAINADIASLWNVYAHVVPNSVEIDRFRPGDRSAARAAVGLPPDRPVIAYFGFLYPSKGFREFIRAAAQLKERDVLATFLVVGGGVRSEAFFRTPLGRVLRLLDLARNYELEARRLVDELGLEDHFRFVPFTPRPDELFRASDVVVAPSQGPEIGRPVLEGAASGVPVIGTGSKTGGGILRPGETTVFVDDFRAGTLARAIADLLGDEPGRAAIGAAAREHAVEMFDPARNARRVEALYERVARSRARTQVLFIHHRPQLGGAPTSLSQLIRNLDRDRYDPHVLVPDGPAASLFADAGAIVHTGSVAIFAHAWDNPYAGFRWLVLGREIASYPSHVRTLRALLRRYRFPIVHLNDSPLLPAARVAGEERAKVVWHLRSALAGDGRDRRSRAIAARIDRWGDAAIAIDDDVAARFPIHLPLRIVHNSVRSTDRTVDVVAARVALGLPPDAFTVGYAGFVRRQKGWPELVQAIRILRDENRPAHLVVIGGGVRPPQFFSTLRGRLLSATGILTDEESAIARLVETLGLSEHVTFVPFRSRLDDFYGSLDAMTFPNQGIGLGRPVLEAAAYGKPVVASGSRTGAGVLLPGETGLLVERATPEAVAAALRTLIDDPALRERLGHAAAQHAADEFDAAKNARRVEAVYADLLGDAVEEPGRPLRAVTGS